MNKLFDELKKYCDNNGIILQVDVFHKDKNRYELTLDNFSPEELKDIRHIIKDYAKIEDDVYLAGNGRAIDIYFEMLDESKKSINESADDNWYKLKMLNEMLDAMEEDEYNIPKLGIYGVTKNISLDKGAIEALIKYYK